MNGAVLAKSARNFLSAIEMKFNRRAGREFIPLEPGLLSIETSSYCNLKCRFCAYTKKQSPKVSMSDSFFQDCVRQAVALGYRNFELTPCTGDVFMDRHILNKFHFLEQEDAVEGYRFFTNFTIPRRRDIETLVALRKLSHLTISIYGHDLESFLAITGATERVYHRLVSNLEALLALQKKAPISLEIGCRSTRNAPRWPTSEVAKLVSRFKELGVPVRKAHVYNNWGGYVTNEDVRGLAIDITGADAMHKNGACLKLFTSVQIMATGIVNGCACRDVDATLRIGDLNQALLRDILSTSNRAYMQLIEEQQRNEFRPVCRSCDFYKSIYHNRSEYRKGGVPMQSLAQFKMSLGRAAGVTAKSVP
jgi:MoaA/NifB/PqqE/SkfB family radical SAM enzyme